MEGSKQDCIANKRCERDILKAMVKRRCLNSRWYARFFFALYNCAKKDRQNKKESAYHNQYDGCIKFIIAKEAHVFPQNQKKCR